MQRSPPFFSLYVVLCTSFGTTYLFHLLIKKYVFSIFKGITEDHLLIEKKSFWGRSKILTVPIDELVSGSGSVFNTWQSIKTGEGFLIQFIPKDQTNSLQSGNGNVTSFQGQIVDSETMNKLYNIISTRR